MKFRRAIPSDKTRRPGPDEYSPMDRLSIYKGEYTKCTMKFRCGLTPCMCIGVFV